MRTRTYLKIAIKTIFTALLVLIPVIIVRKLNSWLLPSADALEKTLLSLTKDPEALKRMTIRFSPQMSAMDSSLYATSAFTSFILTLFSSSNMKWHFIDTCVELFNLFKLSQMGQVELTQVLDKPLQEIAAKTVFSEWPQEFLANSLHAVKIKSHFIVPNFDTLPSVLQSINTYVTQSINTTNWQSCLPIHIAWCIQNLVCKIERIVNGKAQTSLESITSFANTYFHPLGSSSYPLLTKLEVIGAFVPKSLPYARIIRQ
jgi:hypothetical protein